MVEQVLEKQALLRLDGLEKRFPVRRGVLQRTTGYVQAVNGVSLAIFPGETVALVGESGCGKSTTAKMIMGAYPPSGGRIRLETEDEALDIHALRGAARKRLWRNVQLIFQDPYTSLNSRMTVRDILNEPMRNFGIGTSAEREARIVELLENVGLSRSALNRYPHAFSGGQRQRIGIARALAVRPRLLIGDEPVSALDVSVGAQIINLFADLKQALGLTYLLITHDLSLVRHSADRAAVMYLGRIVEQAPTATLFDAPRHPYTQALLAAMPQIRIAEPHRPRAAVAGEVASPRHPPSGCAFHPRCPHATDICRRTVPEETGGPNAASVACHHPLETTEST